jgi:hypothetical protein
MTLDQVAFLRTIAGRTAEMLTAHGEAVLSTSQRERTGGQALEAVDLEEFANACQGKMIEATADLLRHVERVGRQELASLGLLLGQLDLATESIRASPNAFSYELELTLPLSSPWPRGHALGTTDIISALNALKAALNGDAATAHT